MPLEPDFDFIDDLVSANPVTDDDVNEGDNHIRGVKNALQGNVSGSALRSALLQQGIEALGVDDKGAQVVGGVTVTDPAPLNPDELTRMDYVDGLVATLQGLIDQLRIDVDANTAQVGANTSSIANIENGFDFTGPISAPTVTQTA